MSPHKSPAWKIEHGHILHLVVGFAIDPEGSVKRPVDRPIFKRSETVRGPARARGRIC